MRPFSIAILFVWLVYGSAALGLVVAPEPSPMMCRALLALGRGGGGGFPPYPIETFDVSAEPEGGWVWFGGPRAIRNGDSTIIGYQTGTSGGDVKLRQVNNDTLDVEATSTLYDNFIVDDHSPPSVVVRPDGVIMAAFAYHVGDLYVGIGPSPGVLPAQGNVTNITNEVTGGGLPGGAGFTYASILYLPAEGRYYIFMRYHNALGQAHVVYTYSDDDGATWAVYTVVQQITYHRAVVNGTDRIDLVVSDHPEFGQGENPAVNTNIYHLYYESGTGWHKTDGTGLTPTIGNTAAQLVFDGSTSRAWLWDIAVGGDGNPRVVFAVFPGNDGSSHHYYYGRWTGSAWLTHFVADGGSYIVTDLSDNQVYYSGGVALDPEDPTVVWYSSNATGAFQVYRASTDDDGATWTAKRMTNDAAKNVRPVGVLGHDGRLSALWLCGTYTHYTDYSQGIKGAGAIPED